MSLKKSFSAASLIFVVSAQAHAALEFELKKSWYQSRGKSNMEIGNYKAAIEAYEKVLEEDPDNAEAMRSLGIAYENQGFKDKAVAQYDRYLEKNPKDAEIAFRQAEALEWSRYSYRRNDAMKYYEMGLKEKPDTKRRLKYARLLAANHETNAQAIEQYRAVLRSQPRNGDAHRGLAQAYAWNGQSDKAVYHSALAKQYGASSVDLKKLDRDLHKGREPMVGGDFLFITQPGSGSGLNGFQLSASGRTDLGAFVTAQVQAGHENYWQDGNQSSSGQFVQLDGQYRLDERQALALMLGYHSMMPWSESTNGKTSTAADPGNLLAKAEYQYLGDGGFKFTPGFERSLRRDSFLSLVGSAASGTARGAARANQFYADFAWDQGSFEYGFKPYFGWVSALSVSPNVNLGIDGLARMRLLEASAFSLSIGDQMQLAHYGQDRSALSGATGDGYFSPQFFMNQHPHLSAKFRLSDKQEAELSAGPAFQFVRDSSLDGVWQVGANASAGYNARFTERLNWKIGAGYVQVANKFNQVQIDNSLRYTF